MAHLLSPDGIDALLRALGGACSVPVGEGEEVRVVCASLPCGAIVSSTRRGGVLWICLDLDKPSAHRHAAAMLREWRAVYLVGPTGRPRQIPPPVEPVGGPLLTAPIDIPRMRQALAAESVDVPIPRSAGYYPPQLVS